MNYRELQLRQQFKNQQKIWQQEITNLQNSVDVQVVQQLATEIEQLKKANQVLTILATDRKQRLEQEQQALIQLAKQKITNKKEFQQLLNQLQENWQSDKVQLEQEINTLTQQLVQKEQEWKTKRTENKKHWTAKEKQWQKDLTESKEELKQVQSQLTEQAKDNQNLQQENQKKLGQIGLFFDSNTNSYKAIDFNTFYSFFKQIEEERVRQISISDFFMWLEADKTHKGGFGDVYWNDFFQVYSLRWDSILNNPEQRELILRGTWGKAIVEKWIVDQEKNQSFLNHEPN